MKTVAMPVTTHPVGVPATEGMRKGMMTLWQKKMVRMMNMNWIMLRDRLPLSPITFHALSYNPEMIFYEIYRQGIDAYRVGNQNRV